MYQIEIEGQMLIPVVTEEDAKYWAERVGELIPRRSTRIIKVDVIWLTKNLPPTDHINCRPGAAYGVDV